MLVSISMIACFMNLFIIHLHSHAAVVSSLQQTVPPGGVAVCPLGTVQYTCVADTRMLWRELGSSATSIYSALPPANQVDDTGMAGVFNTVLTNINGTLLTSTATIDSVNLTDDGRNISCVGSDDVANFKLVQVEGHYYALLLANTSPSHIVHAHSIIMLL